MLVVGLVGLVGMYLILRQVGVRPASALIGTWVLGANPIYLALSYTFMTDVPLVVLTNLSSSSCSRALDHDRDRDLWMGFVFALLAVFTRQIAAVIFVAFMLAYAFRYGLGKKGSSGPSSRRSSLSSP